MEIDEDVYRTLMNAGYIVRRTKRGLLVRANGGKYLLVTIEPYVEGPTAATMEAATASLHRIVEELTPVTVVSLTDSSDSQPGASTSGPYWRVDFDKAMSLEIDGESYDLSPAVYDETTGDLRIKLFDQYLVLESGASWGQIVAAIRKARPNED